MLHLITHLWISARPPLRYQLSLNYKQRALQLKPKKNPEKGNTEMSACNSPVAVVTKDLLVLSPSPGFWPLAPITAIAACGRSHFSLHYLYISLGHVHPSICSPHIPPSSSPRLSALFPPPFTNPSCCHHLPFPLQPSTVLHHRALMLQAA